MLKFSRSLITLLMLLFSTSVFADFFDTKASVVKQTMADFMQRNNIPGATVELYVDGKPYAYYFGYADVAKKKPVDEKTIFELGSITKVMTSLLLAQEVDMANMRLEDSVRKYLKTLPEKFSDVTLQDLATHTAGLGFPLPNNVKTQAQFKADFSKLNLKYTPGDEWVYSNLGMAMLGDALEAASQKDFDKLYHRHILIPLGMQSIGVTVHPKLLENIAQGYDANGKPVTPYDGAAFPSMAALKASGINMQKFLSAALGLPGTPERVLYPMRMTQTVYVRLPDRMQGLGWQIYSTQNPRALLQLPYESNFGPIEVQEIYAQPTYNGDMLLDKSGSTNGFRSYIALIPNKQTGIVILTNKGATNSEIIKAGRQILYKLNRLG